MSDSDMDVNIYCEKNRLCLLCQKPIVGRQKSAKFCSDRCSSRYGYYTYGKDWRKRKREARPDRFCEECGTKLSGKQKMYCSRKCKSKAHYTSNYERLKERGLRRKLLLIDYKGGRCQADSCPVAGGYQRNISALTFHHRDESKKNFSLDARNLGGRQWATIVDEVEKCDLLCAICHMECHYPEHEVDKLHDDGFEPAEK
jgi:hypothetical protein